MLVKLDKHLVILQLNVLQDLFKVEILVVVHQVKLHPEIHVLHVHLTVNHVVQHHYVYHVIVLIHFKMDNVHSHVQKESMYQHHHHHLKIIPQLMQVILPIHQEFYNLLFV